MRPGGGFGLKGFFVVALSLSPSRLCASLCVWACLCMNKRPPLSSLSRPVVCLRWHSRSILDSCNTYL